MLRKHHSLIGMLLSACCALPAAQAAEPCARAEGAWVRAAAPGIKVMAAYMSLHNTSGKECVLTGVTTPQFRKVEIHETVLKDGVARMQRRDSLSIPADGSVDLAPNGQHLMLIANVGDLTVGDNVALTLKFADDSELPVDAAVRKDAEHDEHIHHNH